MLLIVAVVLVGVEEMLSLKLVMLALVWETVLALCVNVVLLSVPLVAVDCVLLWLPVWNVVLLVAVQVCVMLKLPVVPVTLVCVLVLNVALVLTVLVPDAVRVVSVEVLLILAVL